VGVAANGVNGWPERELWEMNSVPSLDPNLNTTPNLDASPN
jgi:hypothetical protein